MIYLFAFIGILWLIRETKSILFWIYLWQLKEYRIPRFLDHFHTEKGKRLIYNKLLLCKILFLLLFFYGFLNISSGFLEAIWWVPILVSIIYAIEAVYAIFALFQKKLLRPVLTKKTIILIFSGVILEILFLVFVFFASRMDFGQMDLSLVTFYLLLFDIFSPLVVFMVVFAFQPLTILWKNQTIRRASEKRNKFKNLLVIGITGSYGKTSTKEILSYILSEKFKVLKTKLHQNTEIGVAQYVLNELNENCDIFICEMGAYKRREVKLLSSITKPKIGIITGINEQHLALFGSQENIVKAKYELIESLPKDGIAVFNCDNKYCLNLYKKTNFVEKISYGTNLRPDLDYDFFAEDIEVRKDSVSFRVRSKTGERADFKVNLLGRQNVSNILGAVAVASRMGMNLEEIAERCRGIKGEQLGMKIQKGISDIDVIDSSYSANPDGVMAHLEYLKVWEKKKIIIMPCLIELGEASQEVHRRIGEEIAQVCDLAIITSKECFKDLKEAAEKENRAGDKILLLERPEKIVDKIRSFCGPGDVILLEGRVPRDLIRLLKLKK